MPDFLCPVAFLGDHWTDPFRQIECTSLGVAFADTDFELKTYDLCVQEYESTTKHASNIRSDIMSKLSKYIDLSRLAREDGRCVFVSDSDAKLVAALRDDFHRLSCATHDISLAVKAALKAVESTNIVV